MNRSILSIGFVAIGVFLCVSSQSTRIASAVSSAELGSTTGGDYFACGSIITDPAGHACNDCLTDNNGGSFECYTTNNYADETVQYTKGQTPPTFCMSTDPKCTEAGEGSAKHYPVPNCARDPDDDMAVCGRTYRKWMCAPSPGVTCP